MFCNNCGNKISNKATFCPKCGAKIISREANNIIDTQGKKTDYTLRLLAAVLCIISTLFFANELRSNISRLIAFSSYPALKTLDNPINVPLLIRNIAIVLLFFLNVWGTGMKSRIISLFGFILGGIGCLAAVFTSTDLYGSDADINLYIGIITCILFIIKFFNNKLPVYILCFSNVIWMTLLYMDSVYNEINILAVVFLIVSCLALFLVAICMERDHQNI